MRQVTRKGLMTMAAATGVIAAAGGYAQADSGAIGSASDSPGVLSGNTVQAPVNAPVNVCGNTVDVVGVLNPAVGNSCANTGSGSGSGGSNDSGGSGGSGGAQAGGNTEGSPGVGSGNHVEAPINVPVNVCGNSVNVIGVGNSTYGNDCSNDAGSGGQHGTPPGGGNGHTPGDPGQQPGNPGGDQPGNPGGDQTDPGGLGNQGDPVQAGGTAAQGGPAAVGALTPTGSRSAVQAGARTEAQHSALEQLAHTGGDLPLGIVLPAGAGALLAGAVLYRRARQSA
ncbi:chaplin family protein [Streptomyces sp. NPDC018693]|uniref:chaplin family protein n=1 Tax=unclassified Streptomyces TaxID=2593676 RepID=UPI0037B69D58